MTLMQLEDALVRSVEAYSKGYIRKEECEATLELAVRCDIDIENATTANGAGL